MKSLEEKPMGVEMGVESRWRRPGQAVLGLTFAMFIVTVAVLGPPLTGQGNVAMIELRHDVLMIDREFERGAVLLERSSGPTGGVICDERGATGSKNAASKLRTRGGIA
jgi:hypothetical protein